MRTDTSYAPGLIGDPLLAWAARHCAAQAGGERATIDMLRGAGFVIDGQSGQVEHIGAEEFCLLCLHVVMHLDDELHTSGSRRMSVGTCAMAVRILLGAETVEDGIRRMMRFFGLLNVGLVWKLDVAGDVASFSLEIGDIRDGIIPGAEILIIALHMYLSWFCGRALPLLWMSTASRDHPALSDPRGYFIRTPVRWTGVTAIHFPRHCLGWKRQAADGSNPVQDSLRFSLDHVWDRDLSSWTPVHPPAGSRAEAIWSALSEDCTIPFNAISRRLNLTPITLWRGLQGEGTSFMALRRDFITGRAMDLLRGSDVAIKDVADELGFSDARAFRRFMKNAVGRSPSTIRALPKDPTHVSSLRSQILERAAYFDAV